MLELDDDRFTAFLKAFKDTPPALIYDEMKKHPKSLKFLYKMGSEFIVGAAASEKMPHHCEIISSDKSV